MKDDGAAVEGGDHERGTVDEPIFLHANQASNLLGMMLQHVFLG